MTTSRNVSAPSKEASDERNKLLKQKKTVIRNPYPILHIYELGNKFRAIGIPRETFRERFSTFRKGLDISANS